MKLLHERIKQNGSVVSEEILKVDSFLNHQIDANLMMEMGKEFKRRFEDEKITKIVTIEASGIAIAALAALSFQVPVVFAKKTQSRNLDAQVYTYPVYSFTKQQTYDIHISKKYIQSTDRVLILDDFLANGQAVEGLIQLVNQGGGEVAGVGIVIEKGFQPGGKTLRDQGVRVESLAIIDRMKDGEIHFL
ncbi:xanthine phosphoribosyltransferase [Vallitaleaceae bacterium 9-2]